MGLLASAINGHTPDIHLEYMVLVLGDSDVQKQSLLDALVDQIESPADESAVAVLRKKFQANA